MPTVASTAARGKTTGVVWSGLVCHEYQGPDVQAGPVTHPGSPGNGSNFGGLTVGMRAWVASEALREGRREDLFDRLRQR